MRSDFCIFILSHGRADRVETYKTLRGCGYTGNVYIIVDDEDGERWKYIKKYGREVIVFDKSGEADMCDQFDNFPGRGSPLYARNACWKIAEEVGVRFFAQFDDDYRWIGHRRLGASGYHGWKVKDADTLFEAVLRFLEETGTSSIALSQGGDHFGGEEGNRNIRLMRKAMNSFFCDIEKPFRFVSKMNDDVTTYLTLGAVGKLFFTYTPLQISQGATQANPGGITDLYKEFGTYVKSFYSVLARPSCVSIRTMGQRDRRLHHSIRWDLAVPKILRESHRKAERDGG